MITDIFAQEARFNVPGPIAESNWTTRLDQTVFELDQNPQLLGKTQMFERLIRETGR